jgi:MFS family permease
MEDRVSLNYEGVSDWRQIYIVSLFAFVDALQFSFFVWSFWPFVQSLDPTMSPSFIGLIMALSGVGEALSAPVFGYFTNRIGRVNPPLLASIGLSVIGNISYACLNGFPRALMPYMLLCSRFISGASSGGFFSAF